MIRRWWLGAGVVCLLASALLARQGIIKTNDGRSLQGDINENSPDGQSVSVTLHGATVTILRSSIASIDYSQDPIQDFNKRLAKLDPNDIKGLIDLSRWEMDSGQYDLATQAAKDAQRLDPHSPDAAILLNTITSQRALSAKRADANSSPPPSTPAVSAGNNADTNTPPTTIRAPEKYLTMEDVYNIRRNELLPDDEVRVQFNHNVRNRFLSQTGGDSVAFNNETPSQQAMDILQYNDPQLAHDVQIMSDPSSLVRFRTRVQPRILAGCAAAGCHGSTGSGGFFLYPDADQTLPAYTNFYILQRTSRKIEGGDTFGNGPVVRPMIDRIRHESSLLLQFGLPPSLASTPHPKLRNWKPIFHSDQDTGYIEISDWISSLKAIVPDEGIHFDIPTGKSPATQPSTDAIPSTPG